MTGVLKRLSDLFQTLSHSEEERNPPGYYLIVHTVYENWGIYSLHADLMGAFNSKQMTGQFSLFQGGTFTPS